MAVEEKRRHEAMLEEQNLIASQDAANRAAKERRDTKNEAAQQPIKSEEGGDPPISGVPVIMEPTMDETELLEEQAADLMSGTPPAEEGQDNPEVNVEPPSVDQALNPEEVEELEEQVADLMSGTPPPDFGEDQNKPEMNVEPPSVDQSLNPEVNVVSASVDGSLRDSLEDVNDINADEDAAP